MTACCNFVAHWWCSPWISAILASEPRGTRSFKMCSLSTLLLSFKSSQWHTWSRRLRGTYRCNMLGWFGILYREHLTLFQDIKQCWNIFYSPICSNLGSFKPMLLFTIYKHHNILDIKLLESWEHVFYFQFFLRQKFLCSPIDTKRWTPTNIGIR